MCTLIHQRDSHSFPSVFLSLTPHSNEQFHWINLWLLMTSDILFQTIFSLHAFLPAETRAAVACRRAEGCLPYAAPWHVPAAPCQCDSSGRSLPLGLTCSFGNIALLEAYCGSSVFLSRTQLSFINGCIVAVQTLNFQSPAPIHIHWGQECKFTRKPPFPFHPCISERVWYFPSLDTTFLSTDSAGSARTFSESLNLSAHQEAQEARHRNFPSHFQQRGQHRLCPAAQRPIYRHPFTAGTGKCLKTGSIPGAPSPLQRPLPMCGGIHWGVSAASLQPEAFPFPPDLFLQRRWVSQAHLHMQGLVAGWHKACIVHAGWSERQSDCLPWLGATTWWQSGLCHYITGGSPNCKPISRTCLSSFILKKQ